MHVGAATTRLAGHTGSTISLVKKSRNELEFVIVSLDLIPPDFIDSSWKSCYCYGYSVIEDPDDNNYYKIFYNGRNGYKYASESVGVSRIDKCVLTM